MELNPAEAINLAIEGGVVVLSVIIGASLARRGETSERTAAVQLRWLENLMELWLTHRQAGLEIESQLLLHPSNATEAVTNAAIEFFRANRLLLARLQATLHLFPRLAGWVMSNIYQLTIVDLQLSPLVSLASLDRDALSIYAKHRTPLLDALRDFTAQTGDAPSELVAAFVTVMYTRPLSHNDEASSAEVRRVTKAIDAEGTEKPRSGSQD